jgi:hypothetical protein
VSEEPIHDRCGGRSRRDPPLPLLIPMQPAVPAGTTIFCACARSSSFRSNLRCSPGWGSRIGSPGRSERSGPCSPTGTCDGCCSPSSYSGWRNGDSGYRSSSSRTSGAAPRRRAWWQRSSSSRTSGAAPRRRAWWQRSSSSRLLWRPRWRRCWVTGSGEIARLPSDTRSRPWPSGEPRWRSSSMRRCGSSTSSSPWWRRASR